MMYRVAQLYKITIIRKKKKRWETEKVGKVEKLENKKVEQIGKSLKLTKLKKFENQKS